MRRGHDEYEVEARPSVYRTPTASNKGTSKAKASPTRKWRVHGLGEPTDAIKSHVRAQGFFKSPPYPQPKSYTDTDMSEDTQAILRYELYDACEEFTEAYQESVDKCIEGHLFGLLNATNVANDKLGEDKFMKIDEYLARYLASTKPTPDQPDYTHFSETRVKDMSLGDKWTTFCRSCREYQEAVKFSEEVEASDEVREMLTNERYKASLVRSIWHSTLPEEIRLLVPYKITEDTLSWFDAFPVAPPSRGDLNETKAADVFTDAFAEVVSLVTSYLPDAELEDITEIKAQLQETAPHALEGLDEVLRSWDIAKRKMEWAEWVSEQVASGYLEPSTS